MLGKLYEPKGLALETAQAVLEVNNPFACNIAWGCSNQCRYCYVPKLTRQKQSGIVRLPKKPPVELVRNQLERMTQRPEGVFLSFCTDPFLEENKAATENLIEMLRFDYDIKVATLSKLGVSWFSGVRHGVTLVSLDDDFWKRFEPNALPPNLRLAMLRGRGYSWVSMEPYPSSDIHKQDFTAFLEHFALGKTYVDLIVFGKWNYDARAKTEKARSEYAECIDILTAFCKSYRIRLHVKSDTLKFVKGEG